MRSTIAKYFIHIIFSNRTPVDPTIVYIVLHFIFYYPHYNKSDRFNECSDLITVASNDLA